VLVIVPVMLRRIFDLSDAVRARYDTSSLRVIASSGSALGAPLARETLSAFGAILYNVYGSTEVAVATIATPADLTAEPSTAGRAALGTTVRILGTDGAPVPVGETGRIFVGSGLRFEGYTGGGGKEVIGGLLSIGDLGHLDGAGLLFVEGRDDEMIVSGGENVFPSEVEDLLAGHPAVSDVAVVGVADDEFGQRLRAVVVRAAGAKLSAAEVRSYVRDHLARYKVPRDVVFVDELPRNATGKVLRSELRDPSP
jgi:fatty-acyl-CoA synthase